MADALLCCCSGNNGDDDYGDAMLRSAYGLGPPGDGDSDVPGRQVELRLWPSYDANGEFEDDPRRVHLCRYLVPWCIARCLSRLGCDCGLRLSTGGLPGWLLGTRPGRRTLFTLALIVALIFVGWTAYSRGRRLDHVLSSPCYVCHPKRAARLPERWWERDQDGQQAAQSLGQYARYARGAGCSLDDGWTRALDAQLGDRWRNRSSPQPQPPWQRYDAMLGGGALPPRPIAKPKAGVGGEDWRNAMPRLFVVGCRGAGTTSLAHYLDAHPELAVRRDTHTSKSSPAPWDDHFFASVPDWTGDEMRGWLRRGWGAPSLRDHQARGKLRVEVGPDYLWLASTGAASAARRARTTTPRFLVLLADPVRLVQEAHARAVAAGAEDRTSFAQVVADELPGLVQCLLWDDASAAEQRERLISGACGRAEPGRLGPPYLWRGLVSEFLAHWIRTATPGAQGRRSWYFVRSEDLLQQPNRTLNRLGVDFLGLSPFDYGPHVRRVWHPEPQAVRVLAPKAPWGQSWKSFVPRTEYLRRARKKVSDALLDAAGRAVRKVVPGVEAALRTRDQLKKLHCRLAGFTENDRVATQRCLKEKGGVEPEEREEEVDKEAVAEEALRDFFAPFQERLLAMIEAIGDARERPLPGGGGGTKGTGESLRDFYLG